MTTACPNPISTVTITQSSTPYNPNYGSSSTYTFPPPSGTGYVPPPMRTLTAGSSSKSVERGAILVAGLIILIPLMLGWRSEDKCQGAISLVHLIYK